MNQNTNEEGDSVTREAADEVVSFETPDSSNESDDDGTDFPVPGE